MLKTQLSETEWQTNNIKTHQFDNFESDITTPSPNFTLYIRLMHSKSSSLVLSSKA